MSVIVRGVVNYIDRKEIKNGKRICDLQIEQTDNGRPNHVDMQIWSDAKKAYQDSLKLKKGEKVEIICNVGVDKDKDGRYINRIRYYVNKIDLIKE